MDLKRIPTEHLLDRLSGDPEVLLPELPELLRNWMKVGGLYPGRTRTPACDLYQEFSAWFRQVYKFTAKTPTATAWGREMKKLLKRGRSSAGMFYYTSRQSTAKIVEKYS